MKIYDVPLSDLERIATSLGIRAEFFDVSNSRGIRATGRIIPVRGSNPYQRTSSSSFQVNASGNPRRVSAICWHGFRDYFRAVLTEFPNARIQTHMANYQGLSDFEENHRDTGYNNVGSMMYPVYACEACSCSEQGNVN